MYNHILTVNLIIMALLGIDLKYLYVFLWLFFFRNHGIETKVVSRHQFTPELIRWADVLFTAGGDGTYLLAASKVTDKNKPLIGINTDPSR